MKLHEVEESILAFAEIVGAQRIVVVGSQAIHCTLPDPDIDVVVESAEVDLIPLPYGDFEQWFYYAHERLGCDSEFHIDRGYYADMLRPHTAKLPSGWEARAYEKQLSNDRCTVIALFPEMHDLIASKLLANRPQDAAFVRGVASLRSLDPELLRKRINDVELPQHKEHVRAWAHGTIDATFK